MMCLVMSVPVHDCTLGFLLPAWLQACASLCGCPGGARACTHAAHYMNAYIFMYGHAPQDPPLYGLLIPQPSCHKRYYNLRARTVAAVRYARVYIYIYPYKDAQMWVYIYIYVYMYIHTCIKLQSRSKGMI